MSGEAWQEHVKGFVTFLAVQNSFVQYLSGLHTVRYIEIHNLCRLSGKDCLWWVLQQLSGCGLIWPLAVNLTLTFPPPQGRVLASGRLLIGPLAQHQSLVGEFQRAVSHTSRKEKLGLPITLVHQFLCQGLCCSGSTFAERIKSGGNNQLRFGSPSSEMNLTNRLKFR